MDDTILRDLQGGRAPLASTSAPPEGRRVLYLVHDLDDSAVRRRIVMLEEGGAQVTVAGFRRGEGPLRAGAVSLGRTRDARMIHRLLMVARTALRLDPQLTALPRPDAIVARNLEMLAVASRLRRLWPGEPPRLVYEVLDIHRMMLGPSTRARALRGVERRLAASAALLLTSSPGFIRNYFEPHAIHRGPIRLVENKVVAAAAPPPPLPAPSPLAIGWFGVLRCHWSLATLDAVTRRRPGRYRVVLRGRPALDVLPDFHAVIAANPDLDYGGPYSAPEDLRAIYGEVAIAWMVDRFDAGLNSDWLLPNRLYEGGAQGRIPLALDGTEVAAELRRKGIGLILPKPEPDAVAALLDPLNDDAVEGLAAAARAVPSSAWFATEDDCRSLLADILGDADGRTTPAAVGWRPSPAAVR